MRFKVVMAISAVLLLAACSSKPADTGNANTSGTTPPASTATVPQGPAAGSPEEFTTVVGDRIFFGFDRYDLTAEAQGQLQKIAAWLKTYPQWRFVIEGHTDDRGTREYNLALGERRATAAKNYLVALGIDANRMQTISYGKERPVCTESTESCWAQNRRDVIVLQH
ncbi:MAG TPA: peptidoglycan-associated lipoprotein Pal [Dongiaceae bacterium]|nr:peptidoglycan-associated lipoprotein Pal [Dongiaceae bacterium]